MKRIAIFIPTLKGGGAEKMMVHLANEFVKKKYHVDLLVGKAEGIYLDMVDNEVTIIDFESDRMYKTLPKLIKYIRKHGPDSILSALNHTNMISLFAKRIINNDTKHFVSVRSITSNTKDNRFHKWLLKKLFNKSDGVIAISNRVKIDLVVNYSLNEKIIKVIYNPVITEQYLEEIKLNLNDKEIKESFDKEIIMSVGRLVEVKDYPTLIYAFHKASKKRPMKLLIFGEGKEKNFLLKLIRELHLEDSVKLMGFKKNIASYYKYADLFILGSKSEGFGNVIIEAMGSGTNVICARGSGAPEEILRNEEYGFLFNKSNSTDLSEKILYALDNQIGSVYLKKYSNEFHVEIIAEKYLDVLISEKNI